MNFYSWSGAVQSPDSGMDCLCMTRNWISGRITRRVTWESIAAELSGNEFPAKAQLVNDRGMPDVISAHCSANVKSFVFVRRFPRSDRCPPTERRTYVGEPLRRLASDTAAKPLMRQKKFGSTKPAQWMHYQHADETGSNVSGCTCRCTSSIGCFTISSSCSSDAVHSPGLM